MGAFEARTSNESCLSGPSSDPSKCGERGFGPQRGRPACRTHCPLCLPISRTRRAGPAWPSCQVSCSPSSRGLGLSPGLLRRWGRQRPCPESRTKFGGNTGSECFKERTFSDHFLPLRQKRCAFVFSQSRSLSILRADLKVTLSDNFSPPVRQREPSFSSFFRRKT